MYKIVSLELLLLVLVTRTRCQYEDEAGRVTYLCQHEHCDVIQDTSHVAYTHIPKVEGDDYEHIKQTGVWIYYNEEDYTGDSVTAIIGTDVQYDLDYSIKSVRFVGSSLNIQSPSLTLYSGPWFTGDEYYIEIGEQEEDVMIPYLRDFGNRTQSLIVTGGEFSIFGGTSFNGPGCSCVLLTHRAWHEEGSYSAGFYPFLNLTSVKSVGSVCGFCPDACEETWSDNYKDLQRCAVITSTDDHPCSVDAK